MLFYYFTPPGEESGFSCYLHKNGSAAPPPPASVRFNTERRSQHEASYLHHLDTFGFAHLRDSLTGSGSDLWLVHMKSS